MARAPERTTKPPFMSSTRPGEGQYGREVEKWSTVSAQFQEVLQMLSLLNFIPDTSNRKFIHGFDAERYLLLKYKMQGGGGGWGALALLTFRQSRGHRADTKDKTVETPDGTEDTSISGSEKEPSLIARLGR